MLLSKCPTIWNEISWGFFGNFRGFLENCRHFLKDLRAFTQRDNTYIVFKAGPPNYIRPRYHASAFVIIWMPRLLYNLLESVILDSNLKLDNWWMGAHTVPGHIMYRYILKLYITSAKQNYTQHYRGVHTRTWKLKIVRGYIQLCRAMQSYTKVYRAIKNRTGLYTAT